MRYVFVHGLGQTGDVWRDTVRLLPTAIELKCQCPDLPGLLAGENVSYFNLYRAFSAYCDSVQEPLCLCGLSLGGILALHYTISYPEKVQSLVLIGTQYKMPVNLLKFQNVLFRLMPDSLFQKMGFGKSDFISLSKSMMTLDFSGELDKISCPALIVCGEKDRANRNASNELAELLSCAEFRIIEHAGHEVNVDAPEGLAGALSNFWMAFSEFPHIR